MNISRKTLVVGAAVIAFASVGVVAIAQVGDEREPLPNAKPTVASVTDDLASTVAAFDRARTDADVLPADTARFVTQGRPEGANAALSRRVLVDGGRVVYLLPAQSGLCILLADSTGGASVDCKTIDAVRTGAAPPSKTLTGCTAPSADAPPECENASFVGVVPMGVDRVTLKLTSGETVTRRVQEGAYLIDASANPAPVSLSYDGPTGPVEYQLGPS